MNNKRLKSNNAITLIALIITIIVLLILAMVSIKLIWDGGIITHAKNAVNMYSEAETEEKIKLAYSDYKMVKLGNEIYTFEQALTNAGVNYKSVAGNDEEGYVITVETKDGDKQYSVSSSGVSKLKTLEDYGVQIGDYINYDEGTGYSTTVETSKSGYTSKQTKTTENLNWRVLGVNAKGELELISDNPTTDTLYIGDETGYQNAEEVLNDFCNDLYGKGEKAEEARSLNVEDINKLANYDPTTYSGYGDIWTYRFPTEGNYMQYKTTKADGTLVTDWTNITSSIYQTFRKLGETTTINSSNRDDDGISLESTQYVYTISNEISDTAIANMIAKGTGVNSVSFWLASPYVGCGSCNAYFYVRCVYSGFVSSYSLFNSDDSSNNCSSRVRPVVSLNSDIQIDNSNGKDGTTVDKAYEIK